MLVFAYNEAFIQLGFIAFFAVSFPMAPIFSYLTNYITLRFKLKTMTLYQRRGSAIGSDGIGNWDAVIRFITLIAVPINLCVMLYARHPDEDEVGILQDQDSINLEQHSDLTNFLMTRPSKFWTRTNIIILLFGLEHILIAIAIVIDIAIPDVPSRVVKAETNRKYLQRAALKKIEKARKRALHQQIDLNDDKTDANDKEQKDPNNLSTLNNMEKD